MNLAPIELQHGERYGKLTVLRKVTLKPGVKRGRKYVCGCECGGHVFAKARQLMRGEVTACLRCCANRTVLLIGANMEPELKAKWVSALRSGEIRQAQGLLLDASGAMCCVGVLGRVCGIKDDVLKRYAAMVGGQGLELIDEALNRGSICQLTKMNDGDADDDLLPKSFSEIADYIEANL